MVDFVEPMITKGGNKTHKFCPRCSEIKSIGEFHRDVSALDGLRCYCKKCCQEYHLGTRKKQYTGLYKRPFPLDGKCEICSIELTTYGYHHWDDKNPSLGIWVCNACDCLGEGLDEIDRSPWKVDIYRRLKREVEEAERNYTYLGPFLPPNGVYGLFLNNKQTHKWCPHCGEMKLAKEFNKNHSRHDGLRAWCRECANNYIIHSQGEKTHGLHKRPKPVTCELCGSKAHLDYHHWDDGNKSSGVWVCGSQSNNNCHRLAEAVDLIDNNSLLPGKYSELRQGVGNGRLLPAVWSVSFT